jgi:hypothetical protein
MLGIRSRDLVPTDGQAECTQEKGAQDNVKKGTPLAPCDVRREVTTMARIAAGSTCDAGTPSVASEALDSSVTSDSAVDPSTCRVVVAADSAPIRRGGGG